MPEPTETEHDDFIPADAGLPPERTSGDTAPARTGDDLIDAAAASNGNGLSNAEQVDLLSYFLSNDGLPGDDEPHPLEWAIGDGKTARKNVWKVRTIAWEEWQDAIDRTTNQQTGERDVFLSAGYIVARALLEPKLGPAVSRQQAAAAEASDGKITLDGQRVLPPADSAELLTRMFRKQSGVLLGMSGEVLRLSKLDRDGGDTVRTLDTEIEAGKA